MSKKFYLGGGVRAEISIDGKIELIVYPVGSKPCRDNYRSETNARIP